MSRHRIMELQNTTKTGTIDDSISYSQFPQTTPIIRICDNCVNHCQNGSIFNPSFFGDYLNILSYCLTFSGILSLCQGTDINYLGTCSSENIIKAAIKEKSTFRGVGFSCATPSGGFGNRLGSGIRNIFLIICSLRKKRSFNTHINCCITLIFRFKKNLEEPKRKVVMKIYLELNQGINWRCVGMQKFLILILRIFNCLSRGIVLYFKCNWF